MLNTDAMTTSWDDKARKHMLWASCYSKTPNLRDGFTLPASMSPGQLALVEITIANCKSGVRFLFGLHASHATLAEIPKPIKIVRSGRGIPTRVTLSPAGESNKDMSWYRFHRHLLQYNR